MKKNLTDAVRKQENLAALEKVVAAYGNRSQLAAALGLTRQYLAGWDAVPHKFVRQIADQKNIPLNEVLPHPYD